MKFEEALASVLIVGGSLAACRTTPGTASPPAKANVENLAQIALAAEFTPGRQVLVDLVEIPPNTALDRHWHPGEEFHYYMEGEVEIQIDGQPSIHGTPGTVGHVPFRKLHKAVAGEHGAKILVFRVHTEGEPWRYLDQENAHTH